VEVHPIVVAMSFPDLSHLQGVDGYLLLAVVFAPREIPSGALKEAGEDVWVWAKDRRRHAHRRSEGR
jgi:hypothetical protein